MEKKENMGLIAVIVIGLLIVVGVIAYMLADTNKGETNTVTDEIKEETDTITMDDVAGSYYGVFEASDKSIAENAKDAVEDATDDIADTITGEEDNNAEPYRIELVLDADGSAKMVNTENSTDVIEGSYTLNDRTITFTDSDEKGVDEDTTDKIMFTFNTDDTLTYKYSGATIRLSKAASADLEYIK